MTILERAIITATTAHAYQVDKAGERYILHVLRVMLSQRTEESRVVALLHDTVEDGSVTIEAITKWYGPVIAAYVEMLTKKPNESYDAYIDRICEAPLLVRRVKMADIGDNLDENRLEMLPESLAELLRLKYHPALTKLMSMLTEEELRG